MTFRGSVDGKNRFFSTLVYLLPFIDVFPLGIPLMTNFPIISLIYLPFRPLLEFYHGFPFAGLIIFFALFLGVVRNPNVSYFLAFNTLQAILVDIMLILLGLVLRIVTSGLGNGNLLVLTLTNVVFLGTLAVCFYSMFQSARGVLADNIPVISQAVSAQVR
jgi:hypothetical protein